MPWVLRRNVLYRAHRNLWASWAQRSSASSSLGSRNTGATSQLVSASISAPWASRSRTADTFSCDSAQCNGRSGNDPCAGIETEQRGQNPGRVHYPGTMQPSVSLPCFPKRHPGYPPGTACVWQCTGQSVLTRSMELQRPCINAPSQALGKIPDNKRPMCHGTWQCGGFASHISYADFCRQRGGFCRIHLNSTSRCPAAVCRAARVRAHVLHVGMHIPPDDAGFEWQGRMAITRVQSCIDAAPMPNEGPATETGCRNTVQDYASDTPYRAEYRGPTAPTVAYAQIWKPDMMIACSGVTAPEQAKREKSTGFLYSRLPDRPTVVVWGRMHQSARPQWILPRVGLEPALALKCQIAVSALVQRLERVQTGLACLQRGKCQRICGEIRMAGIA